MKRRILFFLVFSSSILLSSAQILNYGARVGTGMAVYVDDIRHNSPILAANVGGFLNIGFTGGQSLFAENFMIQTGLNLVCRGSRFDDVLEQGLSFSLDDGYYKAWYVQLPILATIRYELLLRQPGHIVLFQVGPAVSYGLFGSYYERMISPYMPQTTLNFERSGNAFSNPDSPLNRLDVGAIIGVGYERNDLSVMLHVDYGFLAVSSSVDILKQNENTVQNTKHNAVVPGGNNFGLVLSIGYQIPVR